MPTRRTFLGSAAVAVSGVAAGCGGAKSSLRFFTEREARVLDAILAIVIPSDDAPGAREAGVIHYIDRQLTRKFREHGKTYRAALAALAALPESPDEATLLKSHKPFFELVVTHAMQGFYGNPRHGGNREFASWRMLGIPPLPVRGRAVERASARHAGGLAGIGLSEVCRQECRHGKPEACSTCGGRDAKG
jgi:gluconate 2-dehydrogenase gamma chain